MKTLRIVSIVPYCVFFVIVLAPAGALSYGLAALARTIQTTALSGWRDHG